MQNQVDQFPDGQDAGSNEQPHGTADVTCNIDSSDIQVRHTSSLWLLALFSATLADKTIQTSSLWLLEGEVVVCFSATLTDWPKTNVFALGFYQQEITCCFARQV